MEVIEKREGKISCYFLVRGLNIGGAERQLLHLAKGLKEKGHKVRIITFYSGELDQEAINSGLSLIHLEKKGRWDLLVFAFRLYSYLQKESPDILYSFLEVPNIFSAVLKLLIPKIKVVWGIRSANMNLHLYSYVNRLTNKVMDVLSQFPDKIIFNSYEGRSYYSTRFKEEQKKHSTRMQVIPNGVDFNRFFIDQSKRMSVRKEFGWEDSNIIIALVGRTDPIKDHKTFIEAVSIVIKKQPQLVEKVKFVCLGKGSAELKSALQEKTKEYGLEKYFIWIEKYQDMCGFYNACDIHCLSSISEGCPNVVLESMACGVPNVATNAGDAKKIIDQYGKVCPIEDEQSLAESLIEVINNLSSYSRKEISQNIEHRYSLPKLVESTEYVFEN